MPNDILTIKEVAQFLKINERTVYRLANSGELPAFRVGTSWRFTQADLDAWIEKQKVTKDDTND